VKLIRNQLGKIFLDLGVFSGVQNVTELRDFKRGLQRKKGSLQITSNSINIIWHWSISKWS